MNKETENKPVAKARLFYVLSDVFSMKSFCRVHRTLAVRGDFNVRSFPKSRTYLYRLAFRRPEKEFADVIEEYEQVERFSQRSQKVAARIDREQSLLPFISDEGILEMRYGNPGTRLISLNCTDMLQD